MALDAVLVALGLLYGLVALLAAIPTAIEQDANGIHGILARSAGFAACLLWPVTVVVIAALALREGRRGREALPRRD